MTFISLYIYIYILFIYIFYLFIYLKRLAEIGNSVLIEEEVEDSGVVTEVFEVTGFDNEEDDVDNE